MRNSEQYSIRIRTVLSSNNKNVPNQERRTHARN
jgi:hypothetical protein